MPRIKQKLCVYYFTKTHAVKITQHPRHRELSRLPNCVENPDLSRVKGLPQHLWRLTSRKKIVPLSAKEARKREIYIQTHGTDDAISIPEKDETPLPAPSLWEQLKALYRW